jgi:hypothetical protein
VRVSVSADSGIRSRRCRDGLTVLRTTLGVIEWKNYGLCGVFSRRDSGGVVEGCDRRVDHSCAACCIVQCICSASARSCEHVREKQEEGRRPEKKI